MTHVNTKILSIPPYISTSWKNVALLNVEMKEGAPVLVITLTNGKIVMIPHLEKPFLSTVFAMHAQSMELDGKVSPAREAEEKLSIPLSLSGLGIEHLEAFLQHRPEAADAPDLPQEILGKLSALSKMLGIEDPSLFPKPEPHCNCFHCQIARALHNKEPQEAEKAEESVTEGDLTFRLWNIQQTADKLYTVTHPEDEKEQYRVFLGSPLGCTCGKNNCEHLQAVLRS